MKVKYFCGKTAFGGLFWSLGVVFLFFYWLDFGFFLSLLLHGRFFMSKENFPVHSLCIMSFTSGNLPLITPLKINQDHNNRTSWVFFAMQLPETLAKMTF